MKRNIALVLVLIFTFSFTACGITSSSLPKFVDVTTNTISDELKEQSFMLPVASYEELPAWRGLEYEVMGDYPDGYLFYGFEEEGFAENDIKNIADLGFNFSRVPINTKFYYENADVNQINEKNWINLDQLIGWGIKYGVHISLVVCETYGYNCTYSEEEGELFINDDYMELFLTFWETIAQRYADIPSNVLSFNILNEPCDWIGEERYCELALNVADRIRTHSPDRLIISDMFAWGTEPLYGLVDTDIVQAIHCYEPNIFHNTPAESELADWPMKIPHINSHIEEQSPLSVYGNFPIGTEFSLMVDGLTVPGEIVLEQDGKKILLEQLDNPKKGENNCTFIEYDDNGVAVYARYDLTLNYALEDDDAKEIKIYSTGVLDMISLSIKLPEGKEYVLNTEFLGVDLPGNSITIQDDGTIIDNRPITNMGDYDKEWIKDYLQKYVDFSEKTGVTVFVNEFGVPVTANYEATLSYVDDFLAVVNENGWCWSMYDYIGPFGLVKGANPEHVRDGANYVKFEDCEVDFGLYEVLKKY